MAITRSDLARFNKKAKEIKEAKSKKEKEQIKESYKAKIRRKSSGGGSSSSKSVVSSRDGNERTTTTYENGEAVRVDYSDARQTSADEAITQAQNRRYFRTQSGVTVSTTLSKQDVRSREVRGVSSQSGSPITESAPLRTKIEERSDEIPLAFKEAKDTRTYTELNIKRISQGQSPVIPYQSPAESVNRGGEPVLFVSSTSTNPENIAFQVADRESRTLKATPKPETLVQKAQELDYKAQQIKNPFLRGGSRLIVGGLQEGAELLSFGKQFATSPIQTTKLAAIGGYSLLTNPQTQKQFGASIQANPSGSVGRVLFGFGLGGGAALAAREFTTVGRLAKATKGAPSELNLFGVGRRTRTIQRLAPFGDEIAAVSSKAPVEFSPTPLKSTRSSIPQPQLQAWERSIGLKGKYDSGATTFITVRPDKSVRQFIRTPRETFTIEQAPTGPATLKTSKGKVKTIDRLESLDTVSLPLLRSQLQNPISVGGRTSDLLVTQANAGRTAIRQGRLTGEVALEQFTSTRTQATPFITQESQLSVFEAGSRRQIIGRTQSGVRIEENILLRGSKGQSNLFETQKSVFGDLTPSGFQSEFRIAQQPRQQIVQEQILKGQISRQRQPSFFEIATKPLTGKRAQQTFSFQDTTSFKPRSSSRTTSIIDTETSLGQNINIPKLSGRIKTPLGARFGILPRFTTNLQTSTRLGTTLNVGPAARQTPISNTLLNSALGLTQRQDLRQTQIPKTQLGQTSQVELAPPITFKTPGLALGIPSTPTGRTPFIPNIPFGEARITKGKKGKTKRRKERTRSVTSLFSGFDENLYKPVKEFNIGSGLGVRF